MVNTRNPSNPNMSGIGVKSVSTIRPGESTANQRNVIKDLDDTDRAIIEDCLEKKFSLETTFLTVTDTRLNSGKPRITRPSVEEYYKQIQSVESKYPLCPITGLEAKSVLSITLYGSSEQKEIVGEIAIPMSQKIVSKVSVAAKVEDIESVPMKDRIVKTSFPVLVKSFIRGPK